MTDQLYLEDLKTCDLVVFDDLVGVSVNVQLDQVRLFRKSGGEWLHQQMRVSDIRKISSEEVTPGEFFTSRTGGVAKGLGEGINVTLQNRKEKKSAQQRTGVRISFRSVDLPVLFVAIGDEEKRASAFESLSQIIEGGGVNGKLQSIPISVAKYFHKPTARDIEHQEEINGVFSISILRDFNFLILAFMVASAWVGLEFGEHEASKYFYEDPNLRRIYGLGVLLFPIVWMLVNLYKTQVPVQISIGIAIAFFLYACVFAASANFLALALTMLVVYFAVSLCCMYLGLVLFRYLKLRVFGKASK